ncbi:MAG: glycosyltransferase family 4 protein [Candidatus Saccharimonas sp.]
MRIAMMVRGFITTPPQNDIAYSPAGVAKAIAEGLARKGHTVTFFGPEGTTLHESVAVESCNLRPIASTSIDLEKQIATSDLFSDYRFSLYDAVMARTMLERARGGEFDCVVFNHFESVLPLAPLFPSVPIVYILHDNMDEARREVIEAHASPNQFFISISDSQRRNIPDLQYAATVYNGVDTEHFAFSDEHEDYLFMAGRIVPEKGVKEAVQIAQQTKRRLLIAGSLSPQNYWYFDEHIKPFLDDKILFLGMLDREQLVKYYQKAAAVLAPIQWDEPFGLSMAEANSCGTPVVAFRRGAVPEVVADGKSGYIVDNSAEMIMAIEKLGKISRKDCAARARKHFSEEVMVNNYERILQEIIDNWKKPGSKPTKKRKRLGAKFTRGVSGISRLITGQEK